MVSHKAQEVLIRVPKHFYIYGGLVFCKKCDGYCAIKIWNDSRIRKENKTETISVSLLRKGIWWIFIRGRRSAWKTVELRRRIQQLKNEVELVKNKHTKCYESLSSTGKRKLTHKKIEVIKIAFEMKSIECLCKQHTKNKLYSYIKVFVKGYSYINMDSL